MSVSNMNQPNPKPESAPAPVCSVDSHAHVLDTAAYPFTNPEGYRPGPNECGTPQEFRSVLAAHGMTHALVVNPFAGYGTDNRCMLDGIAASRGRWRGIALVGHDASDAHLRALTEGGVVGARFNTLFNGATSLAGEPGLRLLSRLRELGWFAQVYYHDDGLLELLPILKRARIRVVVDHLGCPDVTRGLAQPGFQALLELGREGNAAVKLSAPFRSSRLAWPYADCDEYVHALIEAFTLDNCLWGSDWPFVRVPRRMDYGPVQQLLARWLPDSADRRRVLWHTPCRWFGFSQEITHGQA
jgi:predicted TIM-barrel fold metal-dependent hydrolase